MSDETNAVAGQVERSVSPLMGKATELGMNRCFDLGCNGCDECTDYADYADEDDGPPQFGCRLPPGECCMPSLHFPSECHTAADYEREQFGGWASDAGPRQTPNVI